MGARTATVCGYSRSMHASPRNNECKFSSQYRKMRVKNGRTCFPRFLRARYLDGLVGIINVLWPVVIERPELHGRWCELWAVQSTSNESRTKGFQSPGSAFVTNGGRPGAGTANHAHVSSMAFGWHHRTSVKYNLQILSIRYIEKTEGRWVAKLHLEVKNP
jgi:hypothetical protein